MEKNRDILIVGAGPTGLTAAIELSRRKIPYRIIDKNIKPVKTSNALAMQARTLEIMNDIGILEKLLAVGRPLKRFHIYSQKEKIASVDLSNIQSRFNFILGIAQHQTETVLLNHLNQLGGNIDMEMELVDIKAENDYIQVHLKHQSGEETTENYRWVLACDGGKSIVREKLKVEFKGRELPQHFVMLDAEVNIIASESSEQEPTAFLSTQGAFVVLPYSSRFSRMIAEVTDDPKLKEAKSPSAEDFQNLIKERCGNKVSFNNVIWSSGFWIRERLAQAYCQRHVFFLGDAAHLHSPVGGQGMNTGIQDAHNLAWKLAMVWRNEAKEKLLSSYEEERRPVAKAVLKGSTLMTYVISLKPLWLIKIRNFIMKKILSSKKILNKIANQLSETNIHYKKSGIISNDLRNGSVEAGSFIKDIPVKDKFLSDYFKKTKPIFIFFIPYQIERYLEVVEEIQKLIVKNNNDSYDFLLIHKESLPQNFSWDYTAIHDENQKIFDAYKITLPMLYLIRPDRYIGYRGKLNLRAFYRALDLLQIKNFPLS